MKTRSLETMPLIVSRARLVAFLYLMLIPINLFGANYVPARLIVPGDVATTASNIMANQALFRLGIATTLFIFVADAIVVLMLYQLLKPIDKNMAALMVVLNLLGVPLAMLNELNQFAIPILLSQGHLSAFTADQINVLVGFFLNLHDMGVKIGGIFWGLWLSPYGYLVFKSNFFPKVFGIFLVVEGFAFLIQSFAAFLLPSPVAGIDLLLAITAWAELFVPLWLVIKGMNVERWQSHALVSA